MGSTTSYLDLYKPAAGETGWGALVNANFDTLDTEVASLMGTATPYLDLYKPDVGETGWGALVNGNFDALDTALYALVPGATPYVGAYSNWLISQLLAEAFGGVEFAPASFLYLGLWTSALDADSDGDTSGEATYGDYARALIGTGNNEDDAWNVPDDDGSGVYVTNMADIALPTCASGSETLTYGAILDESESGNIYSWFTIDSIEVSVGITPTIDAGTLRIGAKT